MTVTVLFATADGNITSGPDTVYSTVRAGTALVANTTGSLTVGQSLSGANYRCREVGLWFDTTPITVTPTVVTLDLYLTTDSSTTDFVLEAGAPALGAAPLTTADWVAGASLSAITMVASINSSGIGSVGAYKTFTSTAAFLTAIVQGGETTLLLWSDRQESGTAPTGAEDMIFASTETAGGTSQDPMLTITTPDGIVPVKQHHYNLMRAG